MQNNRRNEHDDVDLTGIINDYSNDNELRRKIEEMKRQKEGQSFTATPVQENTDSDINPLTGEKFHSAIFEDTKEETQNKKSSIPDIRVDHEELEKTRVGFTDDTSDKTLVIMNGKKSLYAGDDTIEDSTKTQEIPVTRYAYEEEESVNDDEELGKTIVKPLADVHVLDEEEEPMPVKKNKVRKEEPIEEEDDEDDEEKTTKMNKIITYVILGVVGILIIVACFFGVRYVLNNFLGSSDKTKPNEKTEETNTPKDDQSTNTPTDKNDGKTDDVTDSSAKIASLKKQKEAYEQQKKDANEKLSQAEKDKKEAESTLSSLEKNELAKAKKAQNKVSAYENGEYKTANEEYERILGNYNGEKDETVKAQLKDSLDAALERQNAAIAEYNRLTGEASTLTNDYNEKKEEAESKKSTAEETIADQKNVISGLEKNIKDIDKQLKELE